MKKYRATPKLLKAIGNGELIHEGRVDYAQSDVYECLLDINSDWTLSILVDTDAIKKNPDYFREITKGKCKHCPKPAPFRHGRQMVTCGSKECMGRSSSVAATANRPNSGWGGPTL